MVFDLLNEHESRVVVKIVIGLVEMFVEHQSARSGDVITVRVESLVRRGLRLPDVLILSAFDAESEVNAVPALAVESVSNLETFPGLVACEALRRYDLAAAFILGGREARCTSRQVRSFLWEDLFSVGEVHLSD